MPLPVIANTHRVALLWTSSDGQSAVNVLHFQAASASALFTALDTNWTAAMQGFTTTAWQISKISITPLDGTSSTAEHPVNNAKYKGGQTGDYIPAMAVLVHLSTAFRGRSHRGRIYTPGVAEAAQSNGILTAGLVTSTGAAWETFRAAMSTASCELSVASYKLAERDACLAVVVKAKAATQRRRQTRVVG